MKLTEFLDYLRAHATTHELASGLTELVAARRLVPIPLERRPPAHRISG